MNDSEPDDFFPRTVDERQLDYSELFAALAKLEGRQVCAEVQAEGEVTPVLRVTGILERGFERSTAELDGEPYDLTHGHPDRDGVIYFIEGGAVLTITRKSFVCAWFRNDDRMSRNNPDRLWPSVGVVLTGNTYLRVYADWTTEYVRKKSDPPQ